MGVLRVPQRLAHTPIEAREEIRGCEIAVALVQPLRQEMADFVRGKHTEMIVGSMCRP